MVMMSHKLEKFSKVFRPFVEKSWPDQASRLHQAINYCLAGDGKRVRAILSMLVSESHGQDSESALAGAVSVEMIHAYSLAHDDLPCMDNDDFRRGRPSLHKAFDEATALLAGDAILTDAMRVLADPQFFPHSPALTAEQRIWSLAELTRAAGGHGMVYGQDQDMHWTGRSDYDLKTLERIHRGKTGALLGASAALGAIAGGVPMETVGQWREFGVLMGLAFQAVDDVLDESDSTGKSKGKDKSQGKLTFLRFHSNDEVLSLARGYTDAAVALIPKGVDADQVIDFAQKLIFRQT